MAKKPSSNTDPTAKWAALTWNDLTKWAGSTIVGRGRDYFRDKQVKKLAMTDDGEIVAWVEGTERYATAVSLDKKGQLWDRCTCPYDDTCKHAVATVLTFLEALKSDNPVPKAKVTDRRFVMLEAEDEGEWYDDDEWDDDEDDDFEEEEDDDFEEAPPVQAKKSAAKPKGDPIRTYLDGLTKEKLVELVADLNKSVPKAREFITDRQSAEATVPKALINAIRKLIDELCNEGSYGYSRRSLYGNRYDVGSGGNREKILAKLHDKFQVLIDGGHIAEALPLGHELIEAGNELVEGAYDSRALNEGIQKCLTLIFMALPQSGLPALEQVEWVLEADTLNDFDLIGSGLRAFKIFPRKPDQWSDLADALLQWLDPKQNKVTRGMLDTRVFADMCVNALEQAGRIGEIVPFLEKEAVSSNSFDPLVDRLMADERWGDAEKWCIQGIRKFTGDEYHFERALREKLIDIWRKLGKYDRAAALNADFFFSYPSVASYRELIRDAAKTKSPKLVRAAALRFLETGRGPFDTKKKPDPTEWPLEKHDLPVTKPSFRPEFPLIAVLIDIAIGEKDPETVLKWYDRPVPTKNRFGFDPRAAVAVKVAEAITASHPERALEIWRWLVVESISRSNQGGYEEAVTFLRRIRDTLRALGRTNEWFSLLETVRQEHKRKRNFILLLNTFDDDPIAEKKFKGAV